MTVGIYGDGLLPGSTRRTSTRCWPSRRAPLRHGGRTMDGGPGRRRDLSDDELTGGIARGRRDVVTLPAEPKLLCGGMPLAALTWVFAESKVMSSGYMV